MWSSVLPFAGKKDSSGLTRNALRVRRKEDSCRRHCKQTHSEGALADKDGLSERLNTEVAIEALV